MYYGKRSLLARVKIWGVLSVIITGFFAGYWGYSIFGDKTLPVPEPASQVQKPAEAPERPALTIIKPSPRPEPPADIPLRPSPAPVPDQPSPQPERPVKPAADGLWLHVVKSEYKMYLYNGKRLERTYDIAVGANGGQKRKVGDSRTPTGSFTVQQVQSSASWTYDFKDGNGPTPGAYGPWFIRLKTPGWSGIGIHGTHDPSSIGTMITQGCVRMYNHELQELKKRVFKGMKVVISE